MNHHIPVDAARLYAARRHYRAVGYPRAASWTEYANRYESAIADWLAYRLTGSSFGELLDEPSTPALVPSGQSAWLTVALANAYDAAQEQRGSPLRAWRGQGRSRPRRCSTRCQRAHNEPCLCRCRGAQHGELPWWEEPVDVVAD